jgi:peptidoglycan/xylan/chitin deacetylase (PgdA/CDA1 family)
MSWCGASVWHVGGVRSGMVGALALCIALLAACGQAGDRSNDEPAERTPVPAPRVALSADDRELWVRGPPSRAAVPVLVYGSLAPEEFARQLVLLDHAGYETITLEKFVRFVRREQVSLPPRPLLLTFDGGRLDSWTGTDAILRELSFTAVLFVDVGRVERADPEYLTWEELNRLNGSGRWDVQLQSGTGHRRIQYGPSPDDVGPFYAYRGSEEVLGGWRERVFSDITYGEEQLAAHVRGYRPLAFAPPYGNYGQAGTNDRRIPRQLLARLLLSFQVVFTQDRSGFASPRSANPLGRIEVARDLTEAELHTLLEPAA